MTIAPPGTDTSTTSAGGRSTAAAGAAPTRLGLLALLAAGAVLAVGLRVAGRDGLTAGEVVRAIVVVAWALAGLTLVRRRSLQAAGIIVMTGVALAAVTCLASAAVEADWRGVAGDAAVFVRAVGVALLPAVALHFVLALPEGLLVTPGRRRAAVFGYGVALATGVLMWAERPSLPLWPVWWTAAAAALLSLPAANRRYVATTPAERQRLQWVGCAVVVVVEAALVVAALRLLAGWPDSGALAAGATTVLIPLALLAGTWNRLVRRVDRILVHTVAAAGLTGVVVAVYLVVVLGLGRVPDDDERSVLLLSMVAAGVASLLYPVARERLSRFANNLVYGEREAPDELLRGFGNRLSRAIPLDELLLQLAESLRKGMRLSAAEVWTGSHGVLERVVSVPDRPRAQLVLTAKEEPVVARAGVSGPGWLKIWLPSILAGREDATLRVAPVTNSGELLGLLVAERDPEGDTFAEEEERALTELARQVGLALHNVQLDSALQASLDEVRRQADELRASRARIVASADAARRRIERDLHDGAQQQLVALAVNLRLARDLVTEDGETAVAMLDELATALKEAIAELRNLAHGIYPPLLVDSGLAEALRAAVSRSPLDVELQVEEGRYPSEVEAAVYFCCLEALQNAAKHAPGAHVTVAVRKEAEGLLFEVADDGPGFDAEARGRGHGFVNMSDRLGAIGGTVRWDSAPGEGTRVSGAVPVRS